MKTTCLCSVLVRNALTNSSVQCLRFLETYIHDNPVGHQYIYDADLTCLASGGFDGLYDIPFHEIFPTSRDEALSWIGDYLANSNLEILCPLYDPHQLVGSVLHP